MSMLRKGPCDFISWQLRFRNLFGEKGGRPHANETKPPHRKGLATACENNKAQPVTIGYRLGFGSISGPKLSNCSRYRARCAPAYPSYRAALNLQPGRNTMRRSCMRAQLGGIKRESHLHARRATPSSRPAHAVSLRCWSQTRPAYPAPERAGCLPACPSYAPGPRRPQPRGWFLRCRTAFPRTACPPR